MSLGRCFIHASISHADVVPISDVLGCVCSTRCMHAAAGTLQHPRVPPSTGAPRPPCYPWCSGRFSSASPKPATPGGVRGRMQVHPQPRQRGARCAARSSAARWVKYDATAEWERARDPIVLRSKARCVLVMLGHASGQLVWCRRIAPTRTCWITS